MSGQLSTDSLLSKRASQVKNSSKVLLVHVAQGQEEALLSVFIRYVRMSKPVPISLGLSLGYALAGPHHNTFASVSGPPSLRTSAIWCRTASRQDFDS